jgi:hypothetical protein
MKKVHGPDAAKPRLISIHSIGNKSEVLDLFFFRRKKTPKNDENASHKADGAGFE